MTISTSNIVSAPIFESSRARAQRAAKFIDELREELRKYTERETLMASVTFTETCEPQITLSWPGIGFHASAILGDCIHNMRTALDLMASELARLNQRSDRDVYFPFAASVVDFPDAVKAKHFDKCGQDAVDLIKTFSPYKGGNEQLRAIHDLDIQDKHRSLILTMATQDFCLQGDVTCLPVATFQVPVTTKGHQFIFPSGPLESLPVIETLEELVKLINGIIEAFASMVESRGYHVKS